MDITPIVYTAVAGGVGGLAYSYYYKLLTMSTYLVAVEHIAAGAFAGLLVVFMGVFGAPTDYPSALPIMIAGYGGTDVIDSFIQKLQPIPAPASP